MKTVRHKMTIQTTTEEKPAEEADQPEDEDMESEEDILERQVALTIPEEAAKTTTQKVPEKTQAKSSEKQTPPQIVPQVKPAET
jgi:hypothetical protein